MPTVKKLYDSLPEKCRDCSHLFAVYSQTTHICMNCKKDIQISIDEQIKELITQLIYERILQIREMINND